MKYFVALFFIAISINTSAEVLLGVAKNKSDEPIYFERHEVQKDKNGLNHLIRVEYSKPNGNVFATMTSDFSNHKTAPNTVFEDRRFSTRTSVRVSGKNIEIEEVKNNTTSKKSLSFEEPLVIGQGFDNFIRMNAENLDKNQLSFQFLILENKEIFTLSGYKKVKEKSGFAEYGIKVANWLVRIFTDELHVKYDPTSTKLLNFIGRSNIPDDSGKAQDVKINYEWVAAK